MWRGGTHFSASAGDSVHIERDCKNVNAFRHLQTSVQAL
jgi:hypothetical protein